MNHDKPIHFTIIIEGETMSTVTGTYTISVMPSTPTPSPLTITPSSGALPAEIEGQTTSGVVATVSGGVPPYNYTITGQPSGVTFSEGPSADGVAGDADISIGGAPVVGSSSQSPFTVTITVNDSASPTQSAQLTKSIG
jgi:hypothetical protein